jgi:hypothetical protein
VSILLSSGCSFTDGKLTKNSWVNQLAEDLDLLPLNVGKSGYGNQAIFESLIEEITKHKNNISQIVVAWSAADRYDIEVVNEYYRYHGYCKKVEKNEHPFGEGPSSLEIYDLLSKSFNEYSTTKIMKTLLNKSLRYAWLLEKICEVEKIPLLQFSAIEYFYGTNDSDLEIFRKTIEGGASIKANIRNTVKKSKYQLNTFMRLDEAWTWNEEMQILEGNAKDNPIYRVGYNQPSNWYVGYTGKLDFDWHPNELGHTVIKDIIKERLNS